MVLEIYFFLAEASGCLYKYRYTLTKRLNQDNMYPHEEIIEQIIGRNNKYIVIGMLIIMTIGLLWYIFR